MTHRTAVPGDAPMTEDQLIVTEPRTNDAAGAERILGHPRHPRHTLDTGRRTTIAVIAGGVLAAVAGGAAVRHRFRAQRAAIPEPVSGMFGNAMAYLRLGAGPKTLLWLPGGPGNTLPTGGLSLRMGQSWSRPFVEAGYTVWWVTRKQNMPTGHSYADMAEDYAQLIAEQFDGKVDLVLGMSTGGEIGFYLAAGYPENFGNIVIVAAGYEENERAKDLLLRSSRLLSQGRTSQAMALFVADMYPSWPRPLVRALGDLMGRSMYGTTHPYFADDVMVEAEAGLAFDARPVLPGIPVPVLLLCGDRDPYYPKHIYQETARLIPDCTLQMYQGKAHEGVLSDKRFARDIIDFIAQHPTAHP